MRKTTMILVFLLPAIAITTVRAAVGHDLAALCAWIGVAVLWVIAVALDCLWLPRRLRGRR